MKYVYAIVDTLACSILGGLHVFPHDAPATRFFGDIASDSQTNVARHLADHQLVRIGSVDDTTGQLVGHDAPVVVITGAAWAAAQAPAERAD